MRTSCRTVVTLLCLLPSSLSAQSIRGLLVDSASSTPIGGAIVGLLDAKGTQLASTLSDESGRFNLRAPGAGTYTLKSLRIGLRSATSAPVSVGDGQTLEYRFAVRAQPITLETVRVVARGKSCDVRPRETEAAGALWDEARKALTATSITQRERGFAVSLRRYERELDPINLRVLQERSWDRSGVTESPFVSLPATELATNGYVRESETGTVYYAPDAQALLSDEFLDVHCLRAVPAPDDAADLVGVAFEPVKKRNVPDVNGVLWLDRKTAELRYMEYRYTGLGREIPTDRVGGRVEFRRLPVGAWIVERWSIRMPIIAMADRDGSIVPGQSRRRESLRAIREEGGEVTSLGKGTGVRVAGTIAGVIFDSTQSAPLVGARVYLSGTSHWALSDSTGRYTLSPPPGRYELSFVHPRLDSLKWVAPSREVIVAAKAPVELALGVPAAAAPPAVVAVAAKAETAFRREPVARYEVVDATGTPAVIGTVRDLSGNTIPSALVSIAGARAITSRTGEDGAFRLTGVKAGGHRLTVQRIGFRTGVMTIEVVDGKTTRVLLELEEVPAPLPQRRVIANRDRTGFEQRRKMGSGYFLTRDQIEARGARQFTEVLRTVPGVRLVPTQGTMGAAYEIQMGRSGLEKRVRQRNPDGGDAAPRVSAGNPGGDGSDAASQRLVDTQPTGDSACPIEYFVDGSRFVPTSGSIDNDIRPDDVDSIEIYSGSLAPAQFRSIQHTCGTIVIWTKLRGVRDSSK